MPATNWFRKNRRKLLGGLVVFLMIIWGIGPGIDYLVPKPPVGEILGDKVSQEEFNDTAIRWARIFIRDSNQPVSELVWKQMAFIKQAKNMGIFITDDELAQGIQNIFPVHFNNNDEYRRLLGSVFHLTQYQFEKTIRESLLVEKLKSLLNKSIKITDNELIRRYSKENELAKVKYAAFNNNDFIAGIDVNEDEVLAFYNKYSGNFPNSGIEKWGYKEHEKVKLEYILARFDKAEQKIDISEEEMHEYYEEKKDLMFKEDSEYDYKSEGLGEAEGEETDDAATTADTATKYKTFDNVKPEIERTIRKKKSNDIVNKIIGDADNEIYESLDNQKTINFSKLAEKYGLDYVVPTNPDNGTNYFTKEEFSRMVLGVNQFEQQVFERDVNDPSPPLTSMEGKLIFRVLEKMPPQTPPYEEIFGKVAHDVREEKAFEKVKEAARECLEKIKQTTFEEGIKYCEDNIGNTETTETDYFSRPGISGDADYISVLGADLHKLATIAFDLKAGETSMVVEDNDEVKTCYIVTLIDREGADMEKYEAEKDSIRNVYLQNKRTAFLTEWETWIGNKTQLGNK